MKYRVFTIAIALIVQMVATHPVSFAQDGVSSMAMGMARAGLIPAFGEIRVEEFINYHHHAIPLPNGDQRVRLDLKWNRIDAERVVVQAGLATPEIARARDLPPLNVVIVIDRSGSMSGDRIANVKKSLLSFVDRLRPSDLVTIVGFSDQAQVELSACHKTRQKEIREAIERIEAGGSTNLHAGLMLGYERAKEHFDPERSNRVILLSDGVANQGVIDPEQIASASKAFNKQGIDLSTIGLGNDLNHDLLRELTKAGRGQIHFVGDAADIEKTFIEELDSLLAPAARKVRLTIESAGSKPAKIYGYEPKSKGDSNTFRLDDLNHGATQIVLTGWNLKNEPVRVRATLTYVDAITGQEMEVVEQVTLDPSRSTDDVLADADLRKNYSVAVIADAIREAARLAGEKDLQAAARCLGKSIRFAKENSLEVDADVERVVEIARGYRQKIRDAGATSVRK